MQNAASTSTSALEVDDDADRNLREYKLCIEYKYLVDHAPGGVYLLPSLDDNLTLYGCIFVRRGLYRNGVFRFVVRLPELYNSVGTMPVVQFTPPIFNSLVDIDSGMLQMTLNERLLTNWQPEKHFLATVVTILKKSFYMKNFDAFPVGMLANENARNLFNVDKSAFCESVKSCVDNSLTEANLYSEDTTRSSSAFEFTRAEPCHEPLRQVILGELLAQRKAILMQKRRCSDSLQTGNTSSTGAHADAPGSKLDDEYDDNDDSDVKGKMFAADVLLALEIDKWKLPPASSSTDTATNGAPGEAVVTNVLGNGFYDVSNEVEDEEDAQV